MTRLSAVLPNTSYYAAAPRPFGALPPLDCDRTADLCIIGGGFTGLAAALAGAEQGLDTVLIETGRIADGASGRNGGQMIPGLNMAYGEMVQMLGAQQAERLIRTAVSARDRVHDRIARHGIDCDLAPGHVHLAAKPSDMADFADEVAVMNRLFGDGSATLVPAAAVSDHVAVSGYHGAIVTPGGGHFHPMKYGWGLAQAAMAAGASLHESSAAVHITPGAPAVIATAAGRITARHVILAADADMEGLAPAPARCTMPVLNYIIATEPLTEGQARALIPGNAAVSDSRFVLNYFRLSADRRMLFAGGEKYTPRPPRDIAAFVRPHMLHLFPDLAGARIDYAWGGAVGITMNRLPHFGRQDGLWFAHGFSGQGALLTTLAGEAMVAAIMGDDSLFAPFAAVSHRAFPGGRLLRGPAYVAGMAYAALYDRLRR